MPVFPRKSGILEGSGSAIPVITGFKERPLPRCGLVSYGPARLQIGLPPAPVQRNQQTGQRPYRVAALGLGIGAELDHGAMVDERVDEASIFLSRYPSRHATHRRRSPPATLSVSVATHHLGRQVDVTNAHCRCATHSPTDRLQTIGKGQTGDAHGRLLITIGARAKIHDATKGLMKMGVVAFLGRTRSAPEYY